MSSNVRVACGVALALALVVGAVGAGSGVTERTAAETDVPETTASAETAVSTTTTATAGPAGTPETTASPDTAAEYPPGVTAEGLENASALVAAHETALAEAGYEFTFSENTSYEGIVPEFAENETANFSDDYLYFFNDTATVTEENGTVARGLAPGRILGEGSVRYDEYRHEYRTDTWANESVMVSRTEYANQLLLQRATLVREPGEDPFVLARADVNATLTKAHVVNLTLHSGEFAVAGVNRTGNQTLSTLEAVEYDGYDSVFLGPENVTAYDATVVVDERGRVHRLSTTVEGTEYEHVYMHYEFELTRLGPVDVDRPPWTERLRN